MICSPGCHKNPKRSRPRPGSLSTKACKNREIKSAEETRASTECAFTSQAIYIPIIHLGVNQGRLELSNSTIQLVGCLFPPLLNELFNLKSGNRFRASFARNHLGEGIRMGHTVAKASEAREGTRKCPSRRCSRDSATDLQKDQACLFLSSWVALTGDLPGPGRGANGSFLGLDFRLWAGQ